MLICPRLLTLGTLVLLCAAGCGLSDYEAKMAYEQSRLAYFDKENEYLEAPIKWPVEKKEEKKNGDKPAEGIQEQDVFFRPPKGLSPALKPLGGPMYVMVSTQTGNLFQEGYIAVVRAKSREGFQKDVLNILRGVGTPLAKELPAQPGRKAVKYDAVSFEDPNTRAMIHVHFFHDDMLHAAVAFRVAAGEIPALEYSIASLALGNEAGQRHRAFLSRRPVMGK